MRLSFKKSDVEVGGAYHKEYYNNVVIEGKRVENGSKVPWVNDPDWLVIEDIVSGKQPSYAWLVAHKDDIKWYGVDFFVEAPVAFKTSNVPSWLPNFEIKDEDGNVTGTHTFATWEKGVMVHSDNLVGDKFVLKLGALNNSQLTSLDAIATLTGMGTNEASALLKGVLYKAP